MALSIIAKGYFAHDISRKNSGPPPKAKAKKRPPRLARDLRRIESGWLYRQIQQGHRYIVWEYEVYHEIGTLGTAKKIRR